MGELISRRLKASTILETIIALVIILAIFGIATTIFVRAGAVSTSMKKLQAEQVLKAYAGKTEKQQQFFDNREQVDSFDVERQVMEVNNLKKLWRIHYYIYDKGNVLLTDWQQYVLAE